MVVVEKILSHGEVCPSKVAVYNRTELKTYSMLCEDIKGVASKLEALGVKKKSARYSSVRQLL